MTTWRECLTAGVVLMCVVTAANSQARPTVVELFTSEGCSSCPPAESYIGELAQRRDVLALAYHVDYWDELGWRDRFALSQATQRQSIYAQTLRRPSVYTPQIVVDGHSDYVGSDRSSVGRALSGHGAGAPVSISVADAQVLVQVGSRAPAAPGAQLTSRTEPGDVTLVAYLRKAVSAIGRGENAGRTLQEFNIVRALRRLGRWSGQPQTFQARVSDLPPDTTDVAVLVQSIGQGPILGAASIALR